MTTTPKLLTAEQLADVLGLNPGVVARHTRQGRYPFAINLSPAGKRLACSTTPRGLEKWLDARRVGS